MIRAVLFDFGGTLYDYRALEPGDRESLVALARWAGVEAPPEEIRRAHRDAMRRVFHGYLPRRFYLHRDLFRDAVVGMLECLRRRAPTRRTSSATGSCSGRCTAATSSCARGWSIRCAPCTIAVCTSAWSATSTTISSST